MEGHVSVSGEPQRLTLSNCTVDIETSPDCVLVTLSGELDMEDADAVGAVLLDAARSARPVVRVQLAGLSFGDSSAVRALLLGSEAAEEHGVSYELINPSGILRRVLETTGLTEILTIVDEPQPA